MSDGRSGQGRDHPVAVVLTLCAAVVLAGMRSFTAIAGWVADVPAELLLALHGRPAEQGPQRLFPRSPPCGGVGDQVIPPVFAQMIR